MCINIKKILVPGFVAGIVVLIISYALDFIIQAIMPYNVLTLGSF